MLPETEINDFFNLESILEQGKNEPTTVDSNLLRYLSDLFFQLNERLKDKAKRISENNVLNTFSVPEDFDEIVEEYYSRAKCAELFLAYESLPSDLVEIHNRNLPLLQKNAKLIEFQVLNQRGMLQDLLDAGLKPLDEYPQKPKKKSKSGCMATIVIFVLFVSLLCFA